MNVHCPRCGEWVHVSQTKLIKGRDHDYLVCIPCSKKKGKDA